TTLEVKTESGTQSLKIDHQNGHYRYEKPMADDRVTVLSGSVNLTGHNLAEIQAALPQLDLGESPHD
ncbi:MAG: hypothetical protein GY797_32020, partial [Deltaproteobacteria bacterium]|nr:hypothetical protein [Deltaproteobacteria bacterium]